MIKYKVTAVKRSGKILVNEWKQMDFFALEIALALDMLRNRKINKFTVEVSRGK